MHPRRRFVAVATRRDRTSTSTISTKGGMIASGTFDLLFLPPGFRSGDWWASLFPEGDDHDIDDIEGDQRQAGP